MSDHTYLNLRDKFITLIDMKLHAQNQFYISFIFWDLKVLIVSLGMLDPTHDLKILQSDWQRAFLYLNRELDFPRLAILIES